MAATIRIQMSNQIRQPADLVRKQFMDLKYHSEANVHKDLKIEVRTQTADRVEYTQAVDIGFMKLVDEYVQVRHPDGKVVAEAIQGPNAGARLEFVFVAKSPDSTEVQLDFSAPVKGLKRLFAPFLRRAIVSAFNKAYAEDRQDLESGAYSRAQQPG